MTRELLFSIFIGYFLGALPFGYWIAKAHGICLFNVGSRSLGATNVVRTLGKKIGYTVFLLDAFKGFSATYLRSYWGAPYAALLSALVGHSFSCFVHFKGGKGVAALIGGLSFLIPIPLFEGLIVWFLIYKLTHYVSIASMVFVCCLPIFNLFCNSSLDYQQNTIPLIGLACLVCLRHLGNLQRLFSGKENRF